MRHHLWFLFASTYSDRALTIGVYIVGAIFVGLGCYVSIKPPQSVRWRAVCAVIFVVVFGAGFAYTNEQAKRSAKTQTDAAAAANVDAQNKIQYDKDVVAFKAEVVGMQKAIEAVAKGSKNPSWGPLISQIHAASQAALLGQTENPDIKLLKDAIGSMKSCKAFQQKATNMLDDTKRRMREHDSQPNTSAQQKAGFDHWALAGNDKATSDLYAEAFGATFKSVGDELIRRVPSALDVPVRFDRVDSVMDVIQICEQLTNLTQAYINQTCNNGILPAGHAPDFPSYGVQIRPDDKVQCTLINK